MIPWHRFPPKDKRYFFKVAESICGYTSHHRGLFGPEESVMWFDNHEYGWWGCPKCAYKEIDRIEKFIEKHGILKAVEKYEGRIL